MLKRFEFNKSIEKVKRITNNFNLSNPKYLSACIENGLIYEFCF